MFPRASQKNPVCEGRQVPVHCTVYETFQKPRRGEKGGKRRRKGGRKDKGERKEDHLKVVREVDQKEVVILSGCHQVGEIWGDGYMIDAGRSDLREQLL